MKLKQVMDVLNANVLSCQEKLDSEVLCACGADLMSDVLAFAKEKGVLLTGLVNPQVVRTAEMMDVKAIVFVRGKEPSQDVIELAEEKELVVLSTEYPMYVACGLLYQNGLQGSMAVKKNE